MPPTLFPPSRHIREKFDKGVHTVVQRDQIEALKIEAQDYRHVTGLAKDGTECLYLEMMAARADARRADLEEATEFRGRAALTRNLAAVS